ncbi:MAG: phage tail tape measure protein, partial [Paracoccus sp. (in: a-proteobacteria)]|nr:phage tail tape measure protein [Paracoccus sp. (in: a-proteobacteria)]
MATDDRLALDQLEEDLVTNARMTAAFETELTRLRQSMVFTTREMGSLTAGLEGGLRRAFDGLVTDG